MLFRHLDGAWTNSSNSSHRIPFGQSLRNPVRRRHCARPTCSTLAVDQKLRLLRGALSRRYKLLKLWQARCVEIPDRYRVKTIAQVDSILVLIIRRLFLRIQKTDQDRETLGAELVQIRVRRIAATHQ